jgi:hypothetical protein
MLYNAAIFVILKFVYLTGKQASKILKKNIQECIENTINIIIYINTFPGFIF